MGFFDFFKTPDIDQAIANYRQTAGAVLLDVRTPQEYREGHIPGSRSRQASSLLKQMGYTNVQNAGGILFYNGKITK